MTHGFQRREIDRDGVRLSYLDNDAAGPAIVLLHGLAGTGDEFFATAEAVGGPYRFILPDLRGHGASTRRPADLSRAAFVDDVAAVLRHVSPGRPVMLAGQSMGGHTAILAAAALPELIDRLVVLEATVAGGFDPRPLGNWFRSWPLPFASADAAREFLGDDALSRSWVAHLEPAEGGGLVPPFDADVMEAIMAGVAEPYWAQWRSIRMPVTVVFAACGAQATRRFLRRAQVARLLGGHPRRGRSRLCASGLAAERSTPPFWIQFWGTAGQQVTRARGTIRASRAPRREQLGWGELGNPLKILWTL